MKKVVVVLIAITIIYLYTHPNYLSNLISSWKSNAYFWRVGDLSGVELGKPLGTEEVRKYVEIGAVPKCIYNYYKYYLIKQPNTTLIIQLNDITPYKKYDYYLNDPEKGMILLDRGRYIEKINNSYYVFHVFFYEPHYLHKYVSVDVGIRIVRESGYEISVERYEFSKEPSRDVDGTFNLTLTYCPKETPDVRLLDVEFAKVRSSQSWEVIKSVANAVRELAQKYNLSRTGEAELVFEVVDALIPQYGHHSFWEVVTEVLYRGKIIEEVFKASGGLETTLFYGKGICEEYSLLSEAVLRELGFNVSQFGYSYDNTAHGIVALYAGDVNWSEAVALGWHGRLLRVTINNKTTEWFLIESQSGLAADGFSKNRGIYKVSFCFHLKDNDIPTEKEIKRLILPITNNY